MTMNTVNKFRYHPMAEADSWYELLEEEACLQFKWVEFYGLQYKKVYSVHKR